MTWPAQAPMKNSGVTSPPLNPEPSVMTVNKSFQSQSMGPMEAGDEGARAVRMEGLPGSTGWTPSPR